MREVAGMNEPKPFASLTSSILARKGTARPAMRPQLAPLHFDASSLAVQLEEDLGWNDMGDLSDMVDLRGIDEMDDADGTGERHAYDSPSGFRAVGGRIDLSALAGIAGEDYAANDAAAEDYAAADTADDAADEDYVLAEAAEEEPVEFSAPVLMEAEIVTLIPNATPPAAERPEVLRQQDNVVERITAQARKRWQGRAALSEGRRAAFTLRLDAERHLQLRLACTLTGRSAQQLVTDALDKLLSELPDVSALAEKVGEGRQ
jgi:hypothetical protein